MSTTWYVRYYFETVLPFIFFYVTMLQYVPEEINSKLTVGNFHPVFEVYLRNYVQLNMRTWIYSQYGVSMLNGLSMG